MGLPSPTRSLKLSIKPYSTHSSGLRSNTLATHNAAVLRTYGFSSRRHLDKGDAR